MNVPITIVVDDYLPLNVDGDDTFFASVGDDGSFWGLIVEKAFAKFHGNYARTESGDPRDGVSTLNGSPSQLFWTNEKTLEEIWEILETYDSD